jgi:hypothetical protein
MQMALIIVFLADLKNGSSSSSFLFSGKLSGIEIVGLHHLETHLKIHYPD